MKIGQYITRHGYPVISDGETVGEFTSNSLAPMTRKAIALDYVPKPLSRVGQVLEVEIREKTDPATVVKNPFYHSPHR